VEQARENKVYVTVPEASGYGQARAINYGRVTRYLNPEARANGNYAAIMYKD
jgi:hypothetical protein